MAYEDKIAKAEKDIKDKTAKAKHDALYANVIPLTVVEKETTPTA